MPCPRCQSSHITEEYKLTVCTDCGFVLDDSRLREEGPQLTAPIDAAPNPGGIDEGGSTGPRAGG